MRSIFISLYLLYIVTGIVFSSIEFINAPMGISWFSSIMAHLLPLVWFIYLRSGRLTNHSFVSLFTTAGTGTAFLISLASNRMGYAENLSAILPGISFLGWLVYDRWYIVDKRSPLPIASSGLFPILTFQNEQGASIDLNHVAKPKVLIFHSGEWSSFCTFQMSDFEKNWTRFQQMGIEVYFISSQPIKNKLPNLTYLIDNFDAGELLQLRSRQGLPFGLKLFGYKEPIHRPHLYILSNENRLIAEKKTTDFRKRPNADWVLRFFPDQQPL